MKLKDFFNVGPVFGYFFRKKDPNRPKNFDLKMMHGVNKIAVIMFAIAILILITRIILRNFFEY